MHEYLLPTLPLIPLYAETHYRFRYFPFSLYFRRSPEIIFDTPWRVAPDQVPTVFLLIKSANRWPVELKSVTINWESDSGESGQTTIPLTQMVNQLWFHLPLVLPDKIQRPAQISILPTLNFILRGKAKRVTVDNYFGLTKKPLQTFLANESLPTQPGWICGDVHLHTHLTSDQVEFGAPVEMTRHGATVMGLDFVATTDHSYDLDDYPTNYLKNDPALEKWHESRVQMRKLNQNQPEGCQLIPSEEITIRNHGGHNVHLLHYNDPKFFPGSGDGAERWLNTESEHDLASVLSERSTSTISVAAHPQYRVPFLHKLLIDRDEWSLEDLLGDGLNGAQVLSGTPESADFSRSRAVWIAALLKGKKLAIYGGSDAHGNFNVFRQVKMPMINLFQMDDQILGQARTIIASNSTQMMDMMDAMAKRRTAATTAPIGDITLTLPTGEVVEIGDEAICNSGDNITLNISGKSTTEFGPLIKIELYQGVFESQREEVIWESGSNKFELQESVRTEVTSAGYFRLEIKTPGNKRWPGIYLSTPIWVNLKP